MIPVLLKPTLWSVKNGFLRKSKEGNRRNQEWVVIFFSLIVMACIYQGLFEGLSKIRANEHLAYLPPAIPLGLALFMLFAMLMFSSFVSALGALFQSKDLDLIVSSPISKTSFFFGKLTYVYASSSWMALIFGLPVVLAFGTVYSADLTFYLVSVLLMAPLFLIPCALSMVGAIILSIAIPARRTKEVMLLVFVMMFIAIIFIIQAIGGGQSEAWKLNDVLHIISMFSLPRKPWIPTYWAAQGMGASLKGLHTESLLFLSMTWSVAISISSVAFLCVRNLHFAAYSKAKTGKSGLKLNSRKNRKFSEFLGIFISGPYRALISKEYKTFARDMSHALQLLLLLGLCMIYLYNFRVLNAVQSLPEATRHWWKAMLVIANLGMGSFVISAVCTRFVFPSLSLEGKSFWILRTSPLPNAELLKAKFWCWFVPIATISSTIFVSGALAVDAEPHIVALSGVSSWILCYGIVGIGVGLGAVFANFNWEHSSQLAASFGSLVYMLSSMIMIMICLIPIGIMIFLRTFRILGVEFTTVEWYTAIVCCAALITYINYRSAGWAMNIGEQALERR